jgi:hypothetical protein
MTDQRIEILKWDCAYVSLMYGRERRQIWRSRAVVGNSFEIGLQLEGLAYEVLLIQRRAAQRQ